MGINNKKNAVILRNLVISFEQRLLYRDEDDELRLRFIAHLTDYFNDMTISEKNKIDPRVFEEGWPE